MDRYIVTAGYVTVETNVGGRSRARIDITRGADLPADVPPAEVEALLRRGDVELVDEQPAEAVPDPEAVPEGTIPDVIDWVAGDKDRAQLALAAELAKGDKARSTLVDQLKPLAAGE